MLNLFRSKPLIDDDSCEWIFDTFEWALTHFDQQEFFQRSQLIQPTNDFFVKSFRYKKNLDGNYLEPRRGN